MQCNSCGKDVMPTKKFNWFIFILGFVTFGIISFIYLIYYMTKDNKVCPVCGDNVYGEKKYDIFGGRKD